MSLWALVIVIAILGVIVYFVQKAPQIASPFKWLIYILAVGTALYLVLDATGILNEIRGIKVPHV